MIPAGTPRSKTLDTKAHLKFKTELAAKIRSRHAELEAWFAAKAQEAATPFYSSVDLRDAGFKITPVDANLYPAGFNNICPEDQRTAPPIFREQLELEASRRGLSRPSRILILPEAHTTNRFYIENLAFLKEIIESAEFSVRLGWVAPLPEGTSGSITLESESGKRLEAFPIEVSSSGRLSAGGFEPDLIILNNDFSGGYPEFLDRVSQPILPSHHLGWHARRKSEHFRHYNRLAREFAEIAGIDPFVLTIESEEVSPVNFNEDIGVEESITATERILNHTREAYQARGVAQEPFVFLKNNSGTYGMGIMVVHSIQELREMNRRTKNKMSVGKGKSAISSLIVQEGVPTATLVNRLPAEPVIYLVGCELIGGFLRTNPQKGIDENLNAQGMIFQKLCMTDLRDESEDPSEEVPVLELVYGSIARISSLAAGLELKEGLSRRSTSR